MKIYNTQHVGETRMSNEGYKIQVINGSDKPGHVVVSIDDTHKMTVNYNQFKSGSVKNPFHRSVYSMGYIGIGKYKTKENGKMVKAYVTWRDMMQRAYSPKYQKIYPTYKGVSVCKDWHNYQNFAKWYDETSSRIKDFNQNQYDLDKDLLSDKKNKVYSSTTCLLLPHSLNKFLSNKYNSNKTGVTGVHWSESRNKFVAQIMDGDKQIRLGFYDTKEEAGKAYDTARSLQAIRWKKKLSKYLPKTAIDRIA